MNKFIYGRKIERLKCVLRKIYWLTFVSYHGYETLGMFVESCNDFIDFFDWKTTGTKASLNPMLAHV